MLAPRRRKLAPEIADLRRQMSQAARGRAIEKRYIAPEILQHAHKV